MLLLRLLPGLRGTAGTRAFSAGPGVAPAPGSRRFSEAPGGGEATLENTAGWGLGSNRDAGDRDVGDTTAPCGGPCAWPGSWSDCMICAYGVRGGARVCRAVGGCVGLGPRAGSGVDSGAFSRAGWGAGGCAASLGVPTRGSEDLGVLGLAALGRTGLGGWASLRADKEGDSCSLRAPSRATGISRGAPARRCRPRGSASPCEKLLLFCRPRASGGCWWWGAASLEAARASRGSRARPPRLSSRGPLRPLTLPSSGPPLSSRWRRACSLWAYSPSPRPPRVRRVAPGLGLRRCGSSTDAALCRPRPGSLGPARGRALSAELPLRSSARRGLGPDGDSWPGEGSA